MTFLWWIRPVDFSSHFPWNPYCYTVCTAQYTFSLFILLHRLTIFCLCIVTCHSLIAASASVQRDTFCWFDFIACSIFVHLLFRVLFVLAVTENFQDQREHHTSEWLQIWSCFCCHHSWWPPKPASTTSWSLAPCPTTSPTSPPGTMDDFSTTRWLRCNLVAFEFSLICPLLRWPMVNIRFQVILCFCPTWPSTWWGGYLQRTLSRLSCRSLKFNSALQVFEIGSWSWAQHVLFILCW